MDAPLALTGLLSRSVTLGAMPWRRALPPRCCGRQYWLMRFAATVLASVLGLSVPAARAASQPAKKPNLVVLVTIDQFRADYLDRFGPQMTGGTARPTPAGARVTHAPPAPPSTP